MTPEERAKLTHDHCYDTCAGVEAPCDQCVADTVRAAIRDEREACAVVAERSPADCDCGKAYQDCDVPANVAAAIRARSAIVARNEPRP